jgi:hypothetical protein
MSNNPNPFDKPDLNELAHVGVKGMKWGHRKRYSNQDIRNARIRNNSRVNMLARAAEELNFQTSLNPNSKKTEAAVRDFKKIEVDFLKNPDRATALRMTTGEKAALAVLAIGLPGPGTGAAIGTSTARVLARRSQEKSLKKVHGENVSKMARP